MNKSPNIRKGGYRRRSRNRSARRWNLNALINREGGRCQRCGEQVNLVENHPRRATRDHVVPLSKGGDDSLANLALLCNECNGMKGDEVEL